jgi:hypothetical protein
MALTGSQRGVTALKGHQRCRAGQLLSAVAGPAPQVRVPRQRQLRGPWQQGTSTSLILQCRRRQHQRRPRQQLCQAQQAQIRSHCSTRCPAPHPSRATRLCRHPRLLQEAAYLTSMTHQVRGDSCRPQANGDTQQPGLTLPYTVVVQCFRPRRPPPHLRHQQCPRLQDRHQQGRLPPSLRRRFQHHSHLRLRTRSTATMSPQPWA